LKNDKTEYEIFSEIKDKILYSSCYESI